MKLLWACAVFSANTLSDKRKFSFFLHIVKNELIKSTCMETEDWQNIPHSMLTHSSAST